MSPIQLMAPGVLTTSRSSFRLQALRSFVVSQCSLGENAVVVMASRLKTARAERLPSECKS